ncbi:MAG: tetratricopeptide repeat protein [Porticoccaceae bacterium]
MHIKSYGDDDPMQSQHCESCGKALAYHLGSPQACRRCNDTTARMDGSGKSPRQISFSQKRKELAKKKKEKKSQKLNYLVTEPSQSEQYAVLQHYQSGNYIYTEKVALSLTQKYPNHEFGWKVLAAVLQNFGRIPEALSAALKVIKIAPGDAEARFNLGKVLEELERLKEAETSYRDAIVLKPKFPEAHFNLGTTLKKLGKFDAAEASFKRALEIKAEFNLALIELGNLLKQQGRLEEACANFQKAVDLSSRDVIALGKLGASLYDLGRLEEAKLIYEKSINVEPNDPITWNNLGNLYKSLNRLEQAEITYRKSLSLDSGFAVGHVNLAIVLQEMGKFKGAEESCRNAIALDPNFAEAHLNLGIALQSLQSLKEAKSSYEQAILLNPIYTDAHNNLGVTLQKLNRLDEARICFNKAVELNPNYADGHRNLGTCYSLMKRPEEALASYIRAHNLIPNLAYLLGDMLFAKLQICAWDNLCEYINDLEIRINTGDHASTPFPLHALVESPELIKRGTTEFTTRKHPKSNALPVLQSYDNHKRIRVGYFSPDFHNHPVTTVIADLFKNHDRAKFEIHAFSFGPDTCDEWNLRVKDGVDHFHDVRELSDIDIAILARSEEIDIAVDLAGYTKNNRIGIFAMAAAPIQIGYLGFLGTMGADYYDYIIADKIIVPETRRENYSEKIMYVPHYQVNSLHTYSPDLSLTREYFGLPNDVFVFCCFNNTYKFTPDALDVWARILKETDDSVLMLYAKNEITIKNLKREAQNRGVDPSRLIFGDRLSGSEYHARYQAVDLFLDTFLYNGCATSSDALRMGCPVLTCMGDSFSSRFGASLLTSLDLPELITSNKMDYEQLAVELATNPAKFKTIKNKLNQNLTTQPLYNTQKFANSLEVAYLAAHHRCLQSDHPDDICIHSESN